MPKSRTPQYRLNPLPEFQRAMHGLGSSSAAQPHTPTPRKGTRSSNARRAIDDQRDH